VLDKDSILLAGEITNLSIGCEGIIHQFALADLGKTVSALPGGKVVYRALLRPSSLHHFETRVRVRSLEDRWRSTRLDALMGILAKSGRVKEEEAACTFIHDCRRDEGQVKDTDQDISG